MVRCCGLELGQQDYEKKAPDEKRGSRIERILSTKKEAHDEKDFLNKHTDSRQEDSWVEKMTLDARKLSTRGSI